MLGTKEGRKKFEALFHKYRNVMFYSINEIIHDKYLSEDILQETFIKIAENIQSVDKDINSRKAKNFIMIVTKNTALDYYRKNLKRREVEVSVEEIEDLVFYNLDDEILSNLDTENRIITIVKSMNECYRDVLLLKYVNGLKNDKIAKLLNITEETVRKRISRGKKLLKQKLEDLGDK